MMQLANILSAMARLSASLSYPRGSSDAALAPYHVERSTRRTAAVRKKRSSIGGSASGSIRPFAAVQRSAPRKGEKREKAVFG